MQMADQPALFFFCVFRHWRHAKQVRKWAVLRCILCMHSILFSGVTVEEGAIVEDAVVMGHSMIKAGAVVRHCIIAENATIEEDAVVGAKPKGKGIGEVATIAADVTIGKGAKIGPSAMIYEDVKEGEEQC